jgi:hypothetical protein
MKIEFKYEIGQKVEDRLGNKGVISDKRIDSHGKPNYWIDFSGKMSGFHENEIMNAEESYNLVEYDFSIGDIVEDKDLGDKGRVKFINIDGNGSITYLICTKYCSSYRNNDNLLKIDS